MEPTELPGELYERILAELSPPDGQAVSSAHLVDAVQGDQNDVSAAIEGLLRFNVLEFVNTSGSNMHVRVRLHQPTESASSKQVSLADFESDMFWLAYVVDGNDPRRRRARRLFETREPARTHLAQVGSVEELTPVPGVESVWTAYLGDWSNEFAVLREEPVFETADSPWQ